MKPTKILRQFMPLVHLWLVLARPTLTPSLRTNRQFNFSHVPRDTRMSYILYSQRAGRFADRIRHLSV